VRDIFLKHHSLYLSIVAMLRKALLVHFLGLASASPASLSESWTMGQEVKTSSGLIKGHTAPWPANSEVSEYLGIPYAKPPLGSLRFAPPVPNVSNAPFTADKWVRIYTFKNPNSVKKTLLI
jgi:hypothetical protein